MAPRLANGLVLFVLLSCAPRDAPPGSPRSNAAPRPVVEAAGRVAAAPAPQPGEEPPASEGEGDHAENDAPAFVSLDVPDALPAVVSLPRGATGPHPLVVAVHGAGDRPEWQCEIWREIVAARAFVLCPRGRKLSSLHPDGTEGYYHPDHHALERVVLASLRALKARFSPRVDPRGAVYAGYSQGATMGVPFLVRHGTIFPRAVLVEGGFDGWNVAAGRRYADSGGERVLFLCGRVGCARLARASSRYLERAGLASDAVHIEGAGHIYHGPVADAVRERLAWITTGDARWEGGP